LGRGKNKDRSWVKELPSKRKTTAETRPKKGGKKDKNSLQRMKVSEEKKAIKAREKEPRGTGVGRRKMFTRYTGGGGVTPIQRKKGWIGGPSDMNTEVTGLDVN